MTSVKYNKLKQEAEEFSNELRDIMIKLETRRGKIKEGKDHKGVEGNLYSKIDPVINNIQGTLIILQETLLSVLETEDETELLNYIDQL